MTKLDNNLESLAHLIVTGKIKAIIFDLDGTLVSSTHLQENVVANFMHLLYEINISDADKEMVREKGNFINVAKELNEKYKEYGVMLSGEQIQKYWNETVIDLYKTDVNWKEGVLDFIEDMRRRDIRLAIGSNNSTPVVNAYLETNNATEYFEAIKTSSDAKRKQAPDIFNATYEALNQNEKLSYDEVIVIEDTDKGVLSALKAGSAVATIYDEGCTTSKEEMKIMSNWYIDNFYKLNEMIKAVEEEIRLENLSKNEQLC